MKDNPLYSKKALKMYDNIGFYGIKTLAFILGIVFFPIVLLVWLFSTLDFKECFYIPITLLLVLLIPVENIYGFGNK